MGKTEQMNVKGYEITIKKVDGNDYISLTDMLKAKEGEFFVKSWFRNRNTIEFLGVWEQVHNPNFNWDEFDLIRKDAGLNSFSMSVEQWVSRTNAVGMVASAGRYGGTYAHSDIAMEFGLWISPEFKVYFLQEFRRLKSQEQEKINWSAKRELAKINYYIHTDAIKRNLIVPTLTQNQKNFKYASEADLLNVALFGITASEWRIKNPTADGNIRDFASIHQLLVLANMESYNAIMIKDKKGQAERLQRLNDMARTQLKVLLQVDNRLYLPN
jgi:hypothetical protein